MRKALYLIWALALALGLVIPLAGCQVSGIGSQTALATAGPGRIDVDNIPDGGVTGGTEHGFCDPAKPHEWHFVINNLRPEEAAPANMTAVFAAAGEVNIPLEDVTPAGVAHYTLKGYLDDTLVGAYAYLLQQVTYTRFNLSHAPCASEPSPPVQYTIIATASVGGSISPVGNVTVSHGGNQTFIITPDTGYEISDVLVDGASVGVVSDYTFEEVVCDHTIQAAFSLIQYIIIASASVGGSISPVGNVTVSHGGNQTFNIIPDPGYRIVDVSVDGISLGALASCTFENVTSGHNIHARFGLIPVIATYGGAYSLTIPSTEGGWVASPGEGVFPYFPGSVVDLVAIPADGYRFVRWAGDVDAIADVYAPATTITMSTDYQITAEFEPDMPGGMGPRIAGVIKEVNCQVLPGANVTLYQNGEAIGSTVSDEAGNYELPIPAAGDYTVVASKDGFREEAQSISVTEPTTCVLDFVSDHGLIPDAPDVDYVLACVSLWKFGEPPCQLRTSRVLDVISAWVYPIT